MSGADQTPSDAFLGALQTEHLALQGARSTLTAESASRSALYLASVSSSLIAVGFAASSGAPLFGFLAAIIPALLILGEFTYWRLVTSGVEDLHHWYEMQAIRAYYRRLVPDGLRFFADVPVWKPPTPAREFMGLKARDLNVLLTGSSMVAAINSFVAGAGAAVVASATVNASSGPAILVAVVVTLVLFFAHARLALHQYNVGLADLSA